MEQQDIPILLPGSSVFIEHKEASSSPSCIYIFIGIQKTKYENQQNFVI